MTATRRELRFDSLDDVVQDAEALLAKGYDKVGNWSLAQCCGHLANWFRYQMDGFPPAPLLLRPVFWLVRNTIGRSMARKMLAGGKMKDGMPTIPQSVVQPGGEDTAAVADLRETIRRWQDHPGPLHPSPLFGGTSKDNWLKGHLIHCAHHLSFLIPKHA
ncbi:MAG TPA: DUF1569 domain-containing protein [Fimbriiglobus sp.]|nr:DUF1569 domain-containing protein [Fimbriiglobus sp.]